MKKQKIKNRKGAVLISSNDYEDDCPVCQLMKKCEAENREPTKEELKESMIEAKKQGAIVGGEWFEEGFNKD